MVNHPSFYSDKKLWKDYYFPYGFCKSGIFTREQSALLENHGHAYKDLSTGSRAPETDEEKEFVAFCNGDRLATSNHEKAWARYIREVVIMGDGSSPWGTSIKDEDLQSASEQDDLDD